MANDDDSNSQTRRRKTPHSNIHCKWTKEEEIEIQMMIREQQHLLQMLLQR
jgi:hypothetical protein